MAEIIASLLKLLRLTKAAAATAGGLGGLWRGHRKEADGVQARRASLARAARENAGRLEDFAHACDALLIENTRALRAGEAVSFSLPELASNEPAGDDAEALHLESAYRDLEREIAAANRNVEETCRDDYHAGHEEGLMVLEYRAHRAAAAALTLAQNYRTHFGVPRAPLATREQRIEQDIFERAAAHNASQD